MQHLKQSLFPRSLLQQKERANQRRGWGQGGRSGAEGSWCLSGKRADGRCLAAGSTFCSPGYRPGACPRQLWAKLIFVVSDLTPSFTQFPCPLPKLRAFLFLLTCWDKSQPHSLCTEARLISTQWEPSHLSLRDQTTTQPQRPHSSPVAVLPVITSNSATTLLIASWIASSSSIIFAD